MTLVSYQKLVQERPLVEQLSAQLRATLVSLCVEEPLSIVQNTTKGPQSGIEALRRLTNRFDPSGPRAAKVMLQKMMTTSVVKVRELRTALEKLERFRRL